MELEKNPEYCPFQGILYGRCFKNAPKNGPKLGSFWLGTPLQEMYLKMVPSIQGPAQEPFHELPWLGV